nr:proton-dependent oligopeptide transporter family [Tanacetum cinerariifolium]
MEILLIISYLSLGVAVVSTAVVGFCWRQYYVIYHQNLLYVIGNFGATGYGLCVVIILVLLAFGTSRTNLVDNVLTDLVKDIDISEDEEQSNARAAFWCSIAEVSGAVSATMWVANDSIGGVQDSWRTTLLICIIFMTTTVVIFAICFKVYHQAELIQRPISILSSNLTACHDINVKIQTSCLRAVGHQLPQKRVVDQVKAKEQGFKFGPRLGQPVFPRLDAVNHLVTARYRLDAVNHLVDKSANTSISFLWLLPQFCALGCMEGLAKEGYVVGILHVTD